MDISLTERPKISSQIIANDSNVAEDTFNDESTTSTRNH